MNAPFPLGANLAHVLARFRVEEIANDYLAKFASKDAPRPDVRGTNAETVARLALANLADNQADMSDALLISMMTGAGPEEKEKLIQRLEQRI